MHVRRNMDEFKPRTYSICHTRRNGSCHIRNMSHSCHILTVKFREQKVRTVLVERDRTSRLVKSNTKTVL